MDLDRRAGQYGAAMSGTCRPMPGWAWRVGCVLAFLLLFIAVSVWAYLPWWDMAFRSDTSPLSWLSSALLFASAMLALQLGAARAFPRGFSLWLAASLLLLSIDERFMLHEYWKYHCYQWAWCALPEAGKIDALGDLPMLLVGAVGVATWAWLYRAVASRVARALLSLAVFIGVFFALGTHYGVAGHWLPASWSFLEELFEVCAETFFLCGLIETGAFRPSQVQSASSS
jgi:hypothetical protein